MQPTANGTGVYVYGSKFNHHVNRRPLFAPHSLIHPNNNGKSQLFSAQEAILCHVVMLIREQ